MKQNPGPFTPGILTKLLLMHLAVFLGFAATILAVFFSFQKIESFSRMLVETDVRQVVENAQLGRSLNGVFGDTDLLVSTFLNRDEPVQTEAARISSQVKALEERDTTAQLRQNLRAFAAAQERLFQQCVLVQGFSRDLDRLEGELDTEISALEETLSRKLISLAGQGRDTSILEQLSIIIPGYRETLLQISAYHTRLRLKHPGTSQAEHGTRILVLLDDLHLRLRTLTASEPTIGAFGLRLMGRVDAYRSTTRRFLGAMDELQNRLKTVSNNKEQLLTAMRASDQNISQTAGNMGREIAAVMGSTQEFILVVAGGLIISLGLFTAIFSHKNIRRPMQFLLQGVESIRNGNLGTRIHLNRRDEWNDIEEAFNRMMDERRKGDEALRESEQRLLATIQGSPIPIFVIDRDHMVTHWNRALEQLSAIRAEEVIGSDQAWKAFYDQERPTLANLLAKGDDSAVQRWFAGKFSRSRLVDDAYEARDFFPKWGEGGKWLHFTAAALRDTRGNLIGAMETLEDITERILAEEKWHSLFTNLPGGSFTVNREYLIEEVNDVLCATTGYTRQELVGQPCDIICPKGPHKCPIFDLGKEQIDNNETAVKAKDGRLVPIIKSARKITTNGGELIVENFQDITDRKLLEAQLGHSQKMEAIGQLAGGVAHDFNNILTAIIGYGNLLQTKLTDDGHLGKYVNQILYSAERAANLTSSLLAFSRKHIIHVRELNLNEIISRAHKLLVRLVPEDIDLCVFPGPDCTIRADSTQMEQVLMNLVTNARDSMPDGGRLTITTELIRLKDDFVYRQGYGTPGEYVKINVSDNGAGMDETVRERIFEPFFTTKETGKGTGLGLAIVYGIIKQHDGYIQVSSQPGQGTSISIFLPLAEAGNHASAPPDDAPLPRGTETILLAEDEPLVRNIARAILEEFGYTVIEAEDGIDAVDKFREHGRQVQLVMLDVIMPRKNGKQALEAIRQIRPDVKELFMSGYAGDILSTKGIMDDTLNFIPKPLDQRALVRKVRQVLDS